MYPAKPGLLIGFHACDQDVRDQLLNGQTQLQSSKNDYDWLGHGIYFWENNPQRALHFAEELQAKGSGRASVRVP